MNYSIDGNINTFFLRGQQKIVRRGQHRPSQGVTRERFFQFGHSSMALHYGLTDVNEAREYLSHPVLGARLREISNALLEHSGKDVVEILGDLDAKKTRSCMTLFDYLSPNDVFGKVLDTFYKGQRGGRTLRTIKKFLEESCQ